MAVKLWQRFEVTVGGVAYTGGSLSTPVSVTSGDLEVINQTVVLTTSSVLLWSTGGELADFEFMWIENVGDSNTAYVQIAADGDHFVKRMAPGEVWPISGDECRGDVTQDSLNSGSDNLIDDIYAYTPSVGGTTVRIFVVT